MISARMMPLTQQDMLNALPPGGLFPRAGELPWLASPEPLRLSRGVVRRLRGLGHVLAQFQEAAQKMYADSARRDGWVARVLDAGKPEWLVRVQRSPALSSVRPLVLRPDLLLGENDELSLVELDSVPGGMGITLWLSRLYAAHGYEPLGGADGIAQGMRKAHPQGALVAVSEESADYRPEMRWLAGELGAGFDYTEAEMLRADERRMIYRFWELFDSDNVPAARSLCEAAAAGSVELSPPPVAHLEEKLWLALLHAPGLHAEWDRLLRAAHGQSLRRIVPHSWIVDPRPLPPTAALPWLELNSWDEVARLGRTARRLVLKISGFSPLAWGSRSVVVGHDVSAEQWTQSLQRALRESSVTPWVMQEYRETAIVQHPFYSADGELRRMEGRVRLCPYYFRSGDRTELGGCLATVVPSDKKKIHGMADGILVPCVEG